MSNTPTPSNSVVTEALRKALLTARDYVSDTAKGINLTSNAAQASDDLKNIINPALAMQSASTTGSAQSLSNRGDEIGANPASFVVVGGPDSTGEAGAPNLSTPSTGSDELVVAEAIYAASFPDGEQGSLANAHPSTKAHYAKLARAALNAITTPDTDRVAVLRPALERAWVDFLDANPDDLTSPEDLPDHALVTCEQMIAIVDAALSQPLGSQER